MAQVEYQIFTRYYSVSNNECVKNEVENKWISKYTYLKLDSAQKDKILKDRKNIIETVDISSTDSSVTEDNAYFDLINKENEVGNPKFDMIFMYDGLATAEGTGEDEIMYYDNMKRIMSIPWFLNSTCGSLAAAMIKSKELVKMIGKDNVKIAKVVPLDQYIEIV